LKERNGLDKHQLPVSTIKWQ